MRAFLELEGARDIYSIEPLDCQAALGFGQHPGDINQDRMTDFTDPLTLLAHLFFGQPAELPCGEENTSPSNLALVDWNGDGGIDLTDAIAALTFEFLGGDDHITAPSSSCLIIEGCPPSWDESQ